VTPPGCGPLILVVALWEHDETPKDAVTAGFRAFSAELQAAVAAHLLDLNSSDPQVREQAIADITKWVNDRVQSAIEDEVDIGDIFDDFDDVIGTAISTLTTLPDPSAPSVLSLAFGVEQGGRLLFYCDQNRDGTGDTAGPGLTVAGQILLVVSGQVAGVALLPTHRELGDVGHHSAASLPAFVGASDAPLAHCFPRIDGVER